MGAFIPRIGQSEELARTIFKLTKDQPLGDRVFEIESPIGPPSYVVISLVDREDADMDKYAESKAQLRDQLLAGRRHQQLTAWLQQQRDNANVEPNPAFLSDVSPPGLRGGRRR
jgi:peptidyl-prolyl cis-trans isomerase D